MLLHCKKRPGQEVDPWVPGAGEGMGSLQMGTDFILGVGTF
jgi:hypothetical protein